MAKKFVQTYQVSFVKSLDISKDYKKKEKKTFLQVTSSFELEIKPKDLFSVEDYLVPVLLPHNLEAEAYEEAFKEAFIFLESFEDIFKVKLTFWNDGYFTIKIKYPEKLRLTKYVKPLRGKKPLRKTTKLWKGRLATFFFLKKYGYFGKQKTKLKRIVGNFRQKFLRKQKKILAKKNIYEMMGKNYRSDRLIENVLLSRAWGEVTKSFFFKKTFNHYFGWSKSKNYRFQLKLGEVV